MSGGIHDGPLDYACLDCDMFVTHRAYRIWVSRVVLAKKKIKPIKVLTLNKAQKLKKIIANLALKK